MASKLKINWDLVSVIGMWIVALAVVFSSCATAHATSPCNHFFHKQAVVAVPVVAAPVYYQAGLNIEQDALAAKVAKIVIGQLRAELNAPQKQTAPTSAIAQHCGKCHSGAAPKAGIVYDGVTGLACFQVTKALRSIRDESMPKDHKLTPEQKGAVMEELLNLEQPADKSPPPPAPVGQLD